MFCLRIQQTGPEAGILVWAPGLLGAARGGAAGALQQRWVGSHSQGPLCWGRCLDERTPRPLPEAFLPQKVLFLMLEIRQLYKYY